MSKRAPQFERNERDYYPTPGEAVLPLKPYLHPTFEFYEPCAGDGALAIALKGHLGLRCVGMSDIEPQHRAIDRWDALALTLAHVGEADYLITNPPWERELLHRLINHLKWLRPTWLLLDADWLFTGQAAQYIADATHIVPIGRLKWIPGSTHKGKDNACWVCFVGGHDEGPKFHPNWAAARP